MSRPARPIDAVVAVTYRCNARCGMCGIWKSPAGQELPPEAYLRLPASLLDVNLTGGEPFLRDDLAEVHAAVRQAAPRARTVISTNGLLTDRIVKQMRAMSRIEPGMGIAISLDGPAEVHDRVRGVPGTYDRAMATLQALKSEGLGALRLAFTATRQNAQYFRQVYDLAGEQGVQFTCAIEHSSEHYFHTLGRVADVATSEFRAQVESVIRDELRTYSPRRWARAYFMHGMWHFAAIGGRPLPCYAGRDFFFLDPAGNVFTCNAMPFRMGELGQRSFREMFDLPDAAQAIKRADHCQAGCWMVCTVRTAVRHAWPRVLGWALRHKFCGFTLPGKPS